MESVNYWTDQASKGRKVWHHVWMTLLFASVMATAAWCGWVR
jgi:hypothetical protein